MKRIRRTVLLTLALLVPGLLATAQIAPGLFVFRAGTPIVADEVNANFQLLENRIEEVRGDIAASIEELQALEAALDAFEGVPGPRGETGEQGPEGDSAYQVWLDAGNTGTEADFLAAVTGPRGERGPQGERGPAGGAGPQGPQGEQGAPGPRGEPGPEGETGPRGPQGNVGPGAYQAWLDAGNAGSEADFVLAITGPRGERGEEGPRGLQGERGMEGDSAYQVWLDAGNAGTEADFLAAITGPKGERGEQGIQGLRGERGPKGDPGEQGIQGLRGEQGPEGDSAYQVWLDAGNTGSESDFLAAITGPKGERGEQGPKGEPGEGVSAAGITVRTLTRFVPPGPNDVVHTVDAQCEPNEVLLEAGMAVPEGAANGFWFYFGWFDGWQPIDARTTRFRYYAADEGYTAEITMRCLAVAS